MKTTQQEADRPPTSPTSEAWEGTGLKDSKEASGSFLAKPGVALFLLFWALMVQTMLTSGAPAIVGPVLERRFGFTTTQVGALFASIVVLTVVIYMPVTRLGRRRRPLFLAIGLFSIIAGSLLYILPEFVVPYQRSTVSTAESPQLCSSSGNASRSHQPCDGEPTAGVWTAFFLQAAGRALMGFSSITAFALAVAYLGDVAGPQRSSTYLGIYFSASSLGPALGILLSSEFLKLPADLDTGSETGPPGANTTGAWWLINVAGSALALILMPLVALLPEKQTDAEEHETEQLESRFFLQGLKTIVTDPVKAILLLAGAIDSLLPIVALSYSFKLLEVLFSEVDYATYIIAGLVVPLGGAGFLTGGFVTRRLSIRGTIIFCMVATMVTSGLYPGMLIHCSETAPFAGVDTLLTNSSVNLITACNSNCNCSRDMYQPVCGENQISYFSPCHAGCNESGLDGFLNCACVGRNGTATPGECPVAGACPAWKLPVAATFYTLLAVGLALTKSPSAVVLMRLTEEEFKSVTVAISETGKLLTMLGVIPAVGALIDRWCLLWNTDCRTSGSCLRYQGNTVARDFVLINMGFKILSCLCYLGALLLYKGDTSEIQAI
ncbi:solute carrier organic anion transporter family member 4A1-like [Branchiostoma lanceolatum]|uniref:solute carrier organic anion transporter family member 4A1-like n=1 Tax=Branchiostoma lanceolatum TaxID=7740 RepID=UPI0034516882